ncbi:MAG TPA: hypothetical protein EYG92_02925 [Lutibacter sp.]|nr:hypothetical protein [Lutibacter sp.]
MVAIMNKEKNIIVGPKQESIKDFISQLNNDYPELLEKNVIVDLSEIIISKVSEILVFLNIAKSHLNNDTSFVIIASGFNIDSLPDELIVAPTMIEALDIIEMDEIGRDLGF